MDNVPTTPCAADAVRPINLAVDAVYRNLRDWRAREGDYVTPGHQCVAAIDEAVRQLQVLRAAMVRELRTDAEARMARTERLIAEADLHNGTT